jgi:predicted protein tyrosine phosphatase
MIQQITVLSKVKFNELYVALTPIQKSKSAFISINDSFDYKWPNSDNFLNLTFDDVDAIMDNLPDLGQFAKPIVFNEAHASQIKTFIDNNLDKEHLYVHCTMGKCRSGAVGECICDYLNLNYLEFKRQNPQIQPNVHVKLLLNKILNNE